MRTAPPDQLVPVHSGLKDLPGLQMSLSKLVGGVKVQEGEQGGDQLRASPKLLLRLKTFERHVCATFSENTGRVLTAESPPKPEPECKLSPWSWVTFHVHNVYSEQKFGPIKIKTRGNELFASSNDSCKICQLQKKNLNFGGNLTILMFLFCKRLLTGKSALLLL